MFTLLFLWASLLFIETFTKRRSVCTFLLRLFVYGLFLHTTFIPDVFKAPVRGTFDVYTEMHAEIFAEIVTCAVRCIIVGGWTALLVREYLPGLWSAAPAHAAAPAHGVDHDGEIHEVVELPAQRNRRIIIHAPLRRRSSASPGRSSASPPQGPRRSGRVRKPSAKVAGL